MTIAQRLTATIDHVNAIQLQQPLLHHQVEALARTWWR